MKILRFTANFLAMYMIMIFILFLIPIIAISDRFDKRLGKRRESSFFIRNDIWPFTKEWLG